MRRRSCGRLLLAQRSTSTQRRDRTG